MKALILKDYYLIMKQLNIFVLFIFLFSFSIGSIQALLILLAVNIPITARFYEEKSKWNMLEAMLPYSDNSIVLSKYVLSYLSILGIALSVFIIQLIKNGGFNIEINSDIFTCLCIALIIIAVIMPITFKLKGKKERTALFLCFALIVIVGLIFYNQINALLAILGVIVVNIISIMLSLKSYKEKK